MTTPFRALPGVDRLLTDQRLQNLIDEYSRDLVIQLVRAQLDCARQTITDGASYPSLEDLICNIQQVADLQWRPWPRSLINATGVIIHTNLGRAPLSVEATGAIQKAARGYSDLELDLVTGNRGSRQAYITQLLCQLTGAQNALVVNNNASAVLLGLMAIASEGEVIISRGEAVEIGGGFRVPDVLRQSGASLVEVGTTNRTYVHDYENAITERTAAILLVHASNFRVTGFTHSPHVAELVEMGSRFGVPVLHDLGSGCLLDTTQFGLSREPIVQDSIKAGVGLSFFSGDKLLGGPQSGIIVGDENLVDILSRHPMSRAVRIDKLSLAALSTTLMHYVKEEAVSQIPVWRMVNASLEEIESRVRFWVEALDDSVSVVPCDSTIGGGSLPGEIIPSWALSIPAKTVDGGAKKLAEDLRQGQTSVIGRIENEQVFLDPRTVLPEEDEQLVKAVSLVLE